MVFIAKFWLIIAKPLHEIHLWIFNIALPISDVDLIFCNPRPNFSKSRAGGIGTGNGRKTGIGSGT